MNVNDSLMKDPSYRLQEKANERNMASCTAPGPHISDTGECTCVSRIQPNFVALAETGYERPPMGTRAIIALAAIKHTY